MQLTVTLQSHGCLWGTSATWRASERWQQRRARSWLKKKGCSSSKHLPWIRLTWARHLRLLSVTSTRKWAGKSSAPTRIKQSYLSIVLALIYRSRKAISHVVQVRLISVGMPLIYFSVAVLAYMYHLFCHKRKIALLFTYIVLIISVLWILFSLPIVSK